ncbi:MAG: hypothetical protein ACOX86_07220, partial [Pelotomaculaceae bacterium]
VLFDECFAAGLLANATGTFVVDFIFFSLPGVFLLLTLTVTALSGGVGGLLGWELLRLLEKYHFRPQGRKINVKMEKEQLL